jgi:hypothetical protein
MFIGRLLVRAERKDGKVKRLVMWKISVQWNPYILCLWHVHSRDYQHKGLMNYGLNNH